MSAILSADDLNDFITPGVACIKPVETLPERPSDNAYEVTTEDKVAAAKPAQISLTDCLACSGCVTSAEAVLVSLQSHSEVLNTLNAHPPLRPPWLDQYRSNGHSSGPSNSGRRTANGTGGINRSADGAKLFVASVSPQTRASLAATFRITEEEAGFMISQLLGGPRGLSQGGAYGSSFTWIIDTNVVREAALVAAAEEVQSALSHPSSAAEGEEGSISTQPKKPILTSACPGWICYAEKTHPYVLPHLSRLKSPQALAGTIIKSVLATSFGVHPDQVWHLAVMPCFDKKLEASRSELTSDSWLPSSSANGNGSAGIRDVDCVITARELLHLASARNISFASLPRKPVSQPPFPDPALDAFLFPDAEHSGQRRRRPAPSPRLAGPSGGYLYHILQTYRAQHPGSEIRVERGRNADVVEYSLIDPSGGATIVKMARFYGFRNIQNLVRKLKPAKLSKLAAARGGGARRVGAVRNGVNGVNGAVRNAGAAGKDDDYAYVEVMACPGGCTNGGGQIKVSELDEVWQEARNASEAGRDAIIDAAGALPAGTEWQGGRVKGKPGPAEQREWLGRVDEAYFSADSDASDGDVADVDGGLKSNGAVRGRHGKEQDVINGIRTTYVRGVIRHWSRITGVEQQKLLYTSYRKVESDVGKKNDVERVAGLASSIGGGW